MYIICVLFCRWWRWGRSVGVRGGAFQLIWLSSMTDRSIRRRHHRIICCFTPFYRSLFVKLSPFIAYHCDAAAASDDDGNDYGDDANDKIIRMTAWAYLRGGFRFSHRNTYMTVCLL